MPRRPQPDRRPACYQRDQRLEKSAADGWTGVFESRDGWEPSLARRLGKLVGKTRAANRAKGGNSAD